MNRVFRFLFVGGISLLLVGLGLAQGARSAVGVLIRPHVYAALERDLLQYQADVEARFPVRLQFVRGNWSTPDDVRAVVRQLHETEQVEGVILVGALPMHRFHMHDFDNPNPLFYEDYELEFVDADGNGVPERYRGTPNPKLWVANIRGVEGEHRDGIDVLRRFFAKTRAYYSGRTRVERRALAVTDTDWPEGANEFARAVGRPLFGADSVDVLNGPEATPDSIFGAMGRRNYRMFYIQVHSGPTEQETAGGPLTSAAIEQLRGGALFTVNHGCSNCNWMKNQKLEPGRNTGMSWVFGEGIGQALVGNVRIGMVYGQDALYAALLRGATVGEAYLAAKRSGEAEMHREYRDGTIVSGVLLLGNPFLKMTE